MADPISTIPGVSSGIDWAGVVDQMIAVQKRPATRLQASIDANGKKKEALELLRTNIASLQSAANGLRNGKALDAFTVTATGADASGRSVLAATVDATGVPGTHTVNVTSLANAQKTVASSGWTAAQTLSADATLVVGGKNVALAAGDSLATVRDRINAESGTTGVQASIMSVKADGSDQRLVLTGQKTGIANAFALADGSSGALVAELGLTGGNVVDASDAKLTLDGGTTTISRPTNLITDAIGGVTLTLSAKGSSSLIVDRQPNAGINAVQSFVDAYNATQAFVRAQSVAGATLQNDSLVRSVRSTLSTMLLTPAARVDDSGNATAVVDDMTTMATIGVSVKKDGTLSFDQTKFNSIYPSRMNDVRAVLSDRMTTFFGYSDRVTGTYTGEIDKRESQMVTVNGSMQIRIDDLTGRLDKQRSALLAKYAKFEAGLSRIKSVGDALTAQFTAMNKSTN